MNTFLRQITFYLAIVLVGLILLTTVFNNNEKLPEEIEYNTFIQQVNRDEVKEVTMYGGEEIVAVLKDGQTVKTVRPPDHDLTPLLLEKNIKLKTPPKQGPKWWQSAFTYLIPFLMLIGIFFFFMQQSQGGGNRVLNFGKSRARLHQEGTRRKITFEDVAGADEEKAELVEVVDF